MRSPASGTAPSFTAPPRPRSRRRPAERAPLAVDFTQWAGAYGGSDDIAAVCATGRTVGVALADAPRTVTVAHALSSLDSTPPPGVEERGLPSSPRRTTGLNTDFMRCVVRQP
ncbi:hypothetical protein JHN63_21150 [Streptomyces sp. MBT65]|uniref:hypothetical protein n=1 Tax=Streptomyces sp. MBT65 TaxID=1488395 RepID=UPI00190B53D9|nr:hypothetical protein [Streptomyces sp. MBT65]MBK3576280.1 hypothetical protein [Streptomyces sp. MBT65]